MLAELRAPTDDFFDRVTVNGRDEALCTNGLGLLSGMMKAMEKVASFSEIGG